MKKILLLMMTLLLAGCWDVNEPERMYYIHGLGVDYKDGKYEIMAQIIDFTNVAKTEQPNPDAIQVEIGTAKGETVYEAILNLYDSLDLRLFWGHLTFLVFTEEALKEGRANPVFSMLTHYRETRYQIWVYATDSGLKDILLATPILNKAITLAKLSNPLNSYEQKSYLEPINIRKLIIGFNEPSHEITIPYIKISENWETEKGESKATKVEGVAIVTPSEYKGNIMGKEADGLMWMTNETKRAEVTIGEETEAFTAIIDHSKVEIKAEEKGNELKFTAKIYVNATFSVSNREVNEQEIRKAIKKKIEEQVKITYEEGLKNDTDIYRLSDKAYRQQLSTWKKVQEKGKISLNEESLEVEVILEKLNAGRKNFDIYFK